MVCELEYADDGDDGDDDECCAAALRVAAFATAAIAPVVALAVAVSSE